jgi:hypothetical protein
MIRHIKGSEVVLDVHPPDVGHVGKMENRWTHAHTNEQLLSEFGFSAFKGEMWMPAATGFDLVAIVLSGSGSLECDGRTHEFGPGDALIYEPPVEATRLVSPGFRYAYVTHWHSPEDLARHGWLAAGTPRSPLRAAE